RRVALLDLVPWPEDGLNDLFRLETHPHGGKVGASQSAMIPDPMTRHASEFRRREDRRSAIRLPLCPSVPDKSGNERSLAGHPDRCTFLSVLRSRTWLRIRWIPRRDGRAWLRRRRGGPAA